MDIVIIANFCAALDKLTNSRFAYIADMLEKENDVELIGSSFSHGTKKKRICDFSRFSFRVTLIEEPGYKKNISMQRFLSHRTWGKNVSDYIKKRKKPDVVYCAIPSLTAAALVGEYCNKCGIRFIIDIQDLWPEAFKMVFRVPVLSNLLFAPFTGIANRAYAAADAIIAVSQTYIDRARLVNTRAMYANAVYIGTDLATFRSNVCQNKVTRDDDLFWVGHCGSLSDSYDIPCVIDAIKLLNNPKVKLLVMGSGHLEPKFREYARQAGINADFMGYVNYPEMCGLLAACDVTINSIKGKSAASIINKHADYAACGLPVINTQECEEYRKLIEEYQMGVNCRNGSAKDVAEALKRLMNDRKLRKQMGENARRCAEDRFDRARTYQQIEYVVAGN